MKMVIRIEDGLLVDVVMDEAIPGLTIYRHDHDKHDGYDEGEGRGNIVDPTMDAADCAGWINSIVQDCDYCDGTGEVDGIPDMLDEYRYVEKWTCQECAGRGIWSPFYEE